VLLLVSCTVILAVWSPLVVVPAGLLATEIVRRRQALLRLRGRRLAVLLVALAQLLLWVGLVTVPSLFAFGHFVSAHGAIYSFTHSLFPALGVITILLAVIAVRVGRLGDAGAGVIVALSLAVGLAILLWSNRAAPDVWSYYPTKFEWLSVCVLLVMMLALLPAIVLPWASRLSFRLIASVALLSMAAIVCLTAPDPNEANLLVWIDQSANTGEGGAPIAAEILRAGDLSKPTIYWRSDIPNEHYLNFWLIELASRSMQNTKLRTFALHRNETSVTELCAIIALTPGRMTVRTHDRRLSAKLAATCPERSPHVVLLAGGSLG
jgi:hypothetical protein